MSTIHGANIGDANPETRASNDRRGPATGLAAAHGPRLASTCPEAVAIQVEPGGSAAQLECMARLTAIKLDGVAIIVPLDSSTDPQTGQAGLLAMLPVASLPSGRHEVSLNRPDGREGLRYRIPFWK